MTGKLPKAILFLACLTSLILGIVAGLARAGWANSVPANVTHAHGAWMLAGVFLPLIALERAAAIGKPWALLAPCSGLLGNFLWLMGWPQQAQLGYLLGAMGLMILSGQVIRRQCNSSTLTQLLGALLAFLGCLAWQQGVPLVQALHLWSNFLVFTILGERLEFSRWTQGRDSRYAWLTLGLLLSLLPPSLGWGWLLLSLWLLRFDLARRTLKGPKLTRRIARVLLAGYVWLGVAGLLKILHPWLPWPGHQDAFLHAFFLGFIMSMVMGHAPIVFPSLLGLPLGCLGVPTLPVIGLHLSLIARIASDATPQLFMRDWASLGNALALVSFGAYQFSRLIRLRLVSPRSAGPQFVDSNQRHHSDPKLESLHGYTG